ncbi:MAG: hypothetical protein ABSB19_04225 [Methylomonas sp.]|jgi:AMMECR1 domain-containing protein
MRKAIREYLENEEEIEIRNRQADVAWREYQRAGQFVSNETVTAWLDTWRTGKESQCPQPERLRGCAHSLNPKIPKPPTAPLRV